MKTGKFECIDSYGIWGIGRVPVLGLNATSASAWKSKNNKLASFLA